MSVLEWKSINLLNFCPLEDKLHNIKSEITCTCYNSTKKIFADVVGNVHVYSSKWESITFQAHNNPIKLCAITPGDTTNLLITMEQDDTTNQIFLQVFNLNVMRKREGANCVGSAKLLSNGVATVIRVQPIGNQLCIVIGFERGNLLVHRAQVNRDMSSQFRSLNVCLRAITGVEFHSIDLNSWNLFVCSYGGIFSYTITDNNIIADTKNVLDSKNGPTNCCTIRRSTNSESYFTVGRDNAVYCFTNDGRGPCYVIDGRKQFIAWFGNHLIVVKKHHSLFPTQDSAQSSTLFVIDVHNKIVVFNKTMPTIIEIVVDNYNCYVITAAKELYALAERDIQSKVRVLVKKNLYDIAIYLLKGADNDTMLAEVNMQYGDYMMSKGEFSGAVDKYIKTIGIVESYRVIRNLLDSRYNKYLTQYLRALIKSNYSTPDHLELLRCCAEREDLPMKIKDIIVTDTERSDHTFYDLNNFGNDLTIDGTHMNLTKFIEIIHDSDYVCKVLNSWSEQRIYDYLMEHWKVIFQRHSTELLNILKTLCTEEKHSIQLAERFVPLLMTNIYICIEFIEHTISKYKEEETTTCLRNSLIDMYFRGWKAGIKTAPQVLHVLNEQKQYLNIEHMLFQCKNYNFWEGVMQLDERNALRRLCLRHSNNKIDFDDWNSETWLEALEKNDNIPNNSTKMVNYIVKSALQGKQHSLLQVLRSISENKRLTVGQIKDIFTQDHLQTMTSSKRQQEDASRSQKQLHELKDLLSNYSTRPIEFRSNFCDICKKQLKSPAIYYVCQHAYHKECKFSYSEDKSCTICTSDESSRLTQQQISANNIEHASVEDLFETNDMMEAVAKYLSIANVQKSENKEEKMFQDVTMSISPAETSPKNWPGRFNIKESKKPQVNSKATNPFEDDEDENEYDANLNPFAK